MLTSPIAIRHRVATELEATMRNYIGRPEAQDASRGYMSRLPATNVIIDSESSRQNTFDIPPCDPMLPFVTIASISFARNKAEVNVRNNKRSGEVQDLQQPFTSCAGVLSEAQATIRPRPDRNYLLPPSISLRDSVGSSPWPDSMAGIFPARTSASRFASLSVWM